MSLALLNRELAIASADLLTGGKDSVQKKKKDKPMRAQLGTERHGIKKKIRKMKAKNMKKEGKISLSCLNVVKTLTETLGEKFSANSHPILQSFGVVMSKCEIIKKSKKMACIDLIKDQYDILKDALSELEEVKNDDFGDSVEQWTEHDHQIIKPSFGMIKTSIVLVKKTSVTIKKSGLEESGEQFQEYDTILEKVNKLSALVDDLALSLYPPLDWSECKQTNQILKDSLEEVLLCLASLHFMQSDDASKWREFVGKAVIHNFSEIQRVFITQGMAEIKVSD